MKVIWIIPIVVLTVLGTIFLTESGFLKISLFENSDEKNIQNTSSQGVCDEYFEEYTKWAKGEIKKFKQFGDTLKEENKKLENENRLLQEKYDSKSSEVNALENRLDSSLDQTQKFFNELKDRTFEFLEKENLKPQTTIDDQKINWRVSDSKGNLYNWSMPIETYEGWIRATEPSETLRLRNTSTGDIYTVRDHTKFVRTGFVDVIDEVYDNSNNNVDFVNEVWFIVSQLTTYSYDIGEDPRWALETLSRGGGDCEDTAILIAEMLKSSKHTKNWKIQLVYFDAYNPLNPKEMNHVAVSVDDGEYEYIIESTAKEDPYAWLGGVKGWYFEV